MRIVGGVWGTSMSSEFSTAVSILAIVCITSTGYLPTEVSPDSITASAPSMTELATSFTSARVGVKLSIIVSII